MQIIRNWLNGSRNFIVGSTLYKTFGTNQALKELLTKGETPFCNDLLAKEFESMLQTGLPVQPVVETKVVETRVMPETATDEVLQAISNEWKPLYKRMSYLQHSLDKEFDDMNSAEAIAYRYPIALEVLDLEQQINQLWSKRDHYIKEGKLPFVPEVKVELPTDPVEAGAVINNLKKNITRNRLLAAKHPDNPKYAQLYKSYKEKYKQLTGYDYKEKS